MPSWSEIITDVNLYSNAAVELDKKREEYLNKISQGEMLLRTILDGSKLQMRHMCRLMNKIKMLL